MADGISGELIPSRSEIEEQRSAHEIRVNRFAVAVLCVGVTAAAVGVLYYGALVALGISIPFLSFAFTTLSALSLGLSILLTLYSVFGSRRYSRLQILDRRAERAKRI